MTDKNILTERQQDIDLCIKACVNLYGFVTPRQFLKVFNRYYKPKLLKKELLEHAQALENFSGRYYAIYENAIISTRVPEETINRTIHMQEGKSYYTPTQEEVTLYAKPGYQPKTRDGEKIMQFIVQKLKTNVFSANNFVSELIWMTVTDEPMQKRINLLDKYNIKISRAGDFNSLVSLIQDLNNNTRKWANCGYTPVETKNLEN